MYVGVSSAVVLKDVVNAINGEWSVTFHTVECEVPPLTAVVSFEDTQYAIVENAQACVIWIFLEIALLGEFKLKKDKSETKSSESV